ncbi:hypothetical protein CFT12S05168_09220, partial [Campylobacter fetus subsp. testudinum]
SFENLKKVIPFCNNIYFYDNSTVIENEEDQKLSNLKLVAVKNNEKINKASTDKFKWFEELMPITLEKQKNNNFER